MATTIRPRAARLAIASALLAHLQPALASFYTVTSYYVLTLTTTPLYSTCTTNTCRMYTDTETLTVKPTVTPTATPLSSTTYTYSYDDLEVVRLYLAANAVASSDLIPTSTSRRQSGVYTEFAVPVTWTAPSSCPTPFTVATVSDVYLPYQVTAYMSAQSTATSIYTYANRDSTVTYITYIIPQSAVPASVLNPTSNYYYSYFVKSCRNPTATGGAEYYGPTYTARGGSGGSSSGGSGSSGWDDWTVCSALTGCVALATWIIVVATILPALFVFGFIESYFWFRRMMLGKSALRLGTVCWCCLSLWFILLTRRSARRTVADQALLKQYWATLGAGQRIKLWFKWGFRWKYPVELLGNPDGNNPVVTAAAVPPPGGFPPPGGPNGAEKPDPNGTGQQPPMVYMPYPGQPEGQQSYYAPYPGQQQPYPYPPQPGFPQQQPPYMMPQPQPAYLPGQQPALYPNQQPPYPAPSTPGTGADLQQQQQQPMFQSYAAPGTAPSPVQTAASELHSETAVPRGTPPPQGMGVVAEAPGAEVQGHPVQQQGQQQGQQQQQ
ncbi:hypothetical protein C8A05DRAFT_47778 [Staphylotrichum tortipilum]|uniref:Uncharacterized protein n=1 Tax=Staphylotrichum tortipilum TaxID=2831512 RepID=A0AAN6MCY7_9PEZI|nr:hypothetical protein C8A05DRAFT_47778 [Staphylotrichum longicolle]